MVTGKVFDLKGLETSCSHAPEAWKQRLQRQNQVNRVLAKSHPPAAECQALKA